MFARGAREELPLLRDASCPFICTRSVRPRRFRQQLLQVVPLARCISSFCTHDPCGRDLRKARLIASSTTLVPFCLGQVLIRPAHEGKNHVAESANTCIWGAAFFSSMVSWYILLVVVSSLPFRGPGRSGPSVLPWGINGRGSETSGWRGYNPYGSGQNCALAAGVQEPWRILRKQK